MTFNNNKSYQQYKAMLKKKSNKIHPDSSESQSPIQSPRKKQIIKSIKVIAQEVISNNSQLKSGQLPFRISSYSENIFYKERDLKDQDFSNRMSQDICPDRNAIQQIMNSLKKGYFFKKHSANTREPHQKFVYLSQDQDFLCWKSADKNDEKKISLTKIKSVDVGQIGPGLMKLNGSIYPQKCVLIEASQRSLEFQAKNSQIINLFAAELRVCIQMATKFRYRSLPIF